MRGDETDSESVKSADGSIRSSLEALCQELNMDEETAAEALENFSKALEQTWTDDCGMGIHSCNFSLFNGKVLMRVLLCSFFFSSSLIQFFSKMKKWSDMSNLSQDFRSRVGRLERNFEVSTVIFRKFEPIFLDMFQNPQGEPPRLSRSRKHRRLPCHISDVFKFCWTLFVYTKGNFRMIGDDLVNSYHLLLCCLDLVFCNALMCSNKKDLINQYFRGLPKDTENLEEIPCVIDKLCELHDGLVVEAKGIKEHYFKPYIKTLFEKRTLTELLDTPNFQDNNKSINREYEEYVLTVGDFDERVFLGADADEEIGTPRKATAEPPSGQLSARMHVENNLQQHFEKTRSLAPSTPLTGRRYLKEKEVLVTPVSSATQSVSRLQSMVSGLRNAPSEALVQIFNSCSRNPTESILNRVKTMGERFKQAYTKPTDDLPGAHMDFAENRLKLAEILYFKILENIMTQEMKRLQGKDMAVLLEQEVLHCSLLACCLEVVLFAYSSQRTFPWILEIFQIPPFYFYKVIEVFIRSEEGLSRDMVKHLNSIEEQVLESKAWTRDSALWTALNNANNKVPTVEEVNFPSNFDTGNNAGGPTHLPLVALSPIIHPRIREVRTGLGSSARKDVPQSPISLHDRYSSPAAGSAKRRLFGDDPPPQSPVKRISVTPIKIIPNTTENNQNTTTTTTVLSMATGNGQQLTIPLPGTTFNQTGGITVIQLQASDMHPLTAQFLLTASPSRTAAPPTSSDTQPPAVNRPRRTGSLALFFRKVYHLASVRLRDLCLKLDISSELRGKIWTCFEHSLLHCTDLMKDRHLDQLLLCAVYIISKITKQEHTFQDIMKCYRTQPQANSHVYRSVLLKRRPREQQTDENMEVDPTEQANTTEADSESEERGDLIQFYNSVYVLKMKSFALKYAHSTLDNKMEAPPLSPFPSVRAQPLSPRRVSQRHSIFVSPHKNGSSLTPSTAYTYKFTGSPSKELSDINQMIRQGGVSKKRAFTMEGDDTESPSKCLRQENDDVLLKRLQDVVSERASL
uniref:Retinoblastoma-like protein 1 n=1 Tax=Cyprinus carpio TaxID=7962 RepID=A0A8C2JZV0_CYPCA